MIRSVGDGGDFQPLRKIAILIFFKVVSHPVPNRTRRHSFSRLEA